METKACLICGGAITKADEGAARWEGRKYCSPACTAASRIGVARPDLKRRYTMTCQACGSEFEAGGRTSKDKDTKFCSRKCSFGARWRTGSTAKEMSHTQAAYLAGLVDGEGTVMLYQRGGGASMRLTVANTFMPVLEWCASVTGVGNIVLKKSTNPNHKDGGTWMANSQAAASILVQIIPYLVIKKEQALLAIEFQAKLKVPADKAEKGWQEEWRHRMQAMNKRGPTALPSN